MSIPDDVNRQISSVLTIVTTSLARISTVKVIKDNTKYYTKANNLKKNLNDLRDEIQDARDEENVGRIRLLLQQVNTISDQAMKLLDKAVDAQEKQVKDNWKCA